jgi:hyperosmotically inducible protein
MLTAAIAGMALALSVAACSETATNTNTNTANRNTAVVVNANTNTAAHTDNANRREVTREEYEKDKDRYSREAKESGSKVGQGADDLWLWTKTRAALLSEDNLRDSTINVDVDNAVVTLRGTVASNDQKARAEAVAKGIEGVKSVKNTLAVSASGETKNDNASKKAAGDKKS